MALANAVIQIQNFIAILINFCLFYFQYLF
ncbi:hypothetical protein AAKU67_003855 [Oxalobacteraceae bacterium GrIS 2.11]